MIELSTSEPKEIIGVVRSTSGMQNHRKSPLLAISTPCHAVPDLGTKFWRPECGPLRTMCNVARCFASEIILIDRSQYTKDERIAFYTAVINIDQDLYHFCVHCPLFYFYRTKSCSICGDVDNLDVRQPA